MAAPAPLILHVHMPKSAGSALNRRVLRPRFPARRTLLAYGVAHERRRGLDTADLSGAPDLIAGHVPFGFAAPLGRPVLTVSVLRDPVERMFSFLNFVAVAPRHGARRRFDVDMVRLAQDDPGRFIEMMLGCDMVRLRQTNLMVRLAGGMPRLSKRSPGRWRLALALRRVRGGDYLVGAQDDFDAFAARVAARLDEVGAGATGANPGVAEGAKAEKRLPHVIRREDATPQTLSAVRDANALDQRLYDEVVEASLARPAVA